MTALPTPRGTELTPEEYEEFLLTLSDHGRAALQAQEKTTRVRDLAFEMLTTLEKITSYEYAMDHVFSSVMRAKIRAILKEAHGE